MSHASVEVRQWLAEYELSNLALLESDPEFRQWLEEEYVPIGGGWQY